MDLAKLLFEFLGKLAWPGTVLAIVWLFRRELRRIAAGVTRIEYPGGSITLREIERLEADANVKGRESQAEIVKNHALFQLAGDSDLSLAHIRVDIEKELFRLAQVRGGIVFPLPIAKRLRDLEENHRIPRSLAQSLADFSDIYDRISRDPNVSAEVKQRVSTIGLTLLSQLHRDRLVSTMEYEFDAHGIWHMHQHREGEAKKYYWWSAIASECPTFDYDYDVYRTATERFNEKMAAQIGEGYVPIVVPSLKEYVSILEFRESEIRRVLGEWENGQDAYRKANEWMWPAAWGDIGWNRTFAFGWPRDAEQALHDTQFAINKYRSVNSGGE